MFGRKYTSLIPSISLENPKEDYKESKRIGQYRASTRALYKPDGTYLPFQAVIDTILDQTSVHVSGCCVGGVPVERIQFVTAEGKSPFLFDSKKRSGKGIKCDGSDKTVTYLQVLCTENRIGCDRLVFGKIMLILVGKGKENENRGNIKYNCDNYCSFNYGSYKSVFAKPCGKT